MALENCPSCENQVSRKAESCPKCGHVFKKSGAFDPTNLVHVFGIIAFIFLVALFVI